MSEHCYVVLADYSDDWEAQDEPGFPWTLAHSHPSHTSLPGYPKFAIYGVHGQAVRRANCILDHATHIEKWTMSRLKDVMAQADGEWPLVLRQPDLSEEPQTPNKSGEPPMEAIEPASPEEISYLQVIEQELRVMSETLQEMTIRLGNVMKHRNEIMYQRNKLWTENVRLAKELKELKEGSNPCS
jgi:hypothetical protein